ncbi:MAG: methyl-accepting chemotaxis protein [Hoeflea sp.]|uniref:methyl-accepting chemotaxis protein n=1 Tax=Hoeflea sp. TaxID=1940281 RepID=UPI003EF2ACEB
MTLKARIFLLAPLAMIGMLLVGGIFFYGNTVEDSYRSELAKINALGTADAKVAKSLLLARRYEKDFLLRGDEKYITLHQEVVEQGTTRIADLTSAARAEYGAALDEHLSSLSNAFEHYVTGFGSVVEKNLLVGLDEKSGLQGSLRTAVQEAEAFLDTLGQPEMLVKMLMMRRHEKDFIMRGDEKYVGRLNDRVAEFKQFPLSMFGSLDNQRTIFALLDTYQADFQAYATASTEEHAARGELSTAFTEIETELLEIEEFNDEHREEVMHELEIAHATVIKTVVGVTLATILIILGIVVLVARSVSKPLLSTVAALQALARDETGVEIEGKDRKDEIGAIAVAFKACQDLAIVKARKEQEAANEREAEERSRGAEQARLDAEQKRNLETAMTALDEGLGRLAEGDLTSAISQPFAGELDNLRKSFNASVEKLSETLSEVKISTDGIHGNAEEMRAAVDDLSNRTERQAAALEESSAALEQINSTVASSSNRAQDAAKKVAEAKTASDSSTKIVSDAVDAMGNIKDASSEISKIIGVIDEIAFQTNLLALNAGVEAARAGEAGKGFAVVAQEVRELAQRSATAAKEIKGLIGKSSTAVESGVNLVKATGDALAVIAGHVADINDHINSIATAAKEQSTGLQEVSGAVGQMDQVTQQNAAMVEETTALTHRLSDETTQLSSLVQRFRLADSRGQVARGPVAVASNAASRPSPAKAMVNKVRQAFATNGSAAVEQEWSEF